jgi:phosphoserine phosphatase
VNELVDLLLALPPGEAVFDMDGTLIANDLGESAVRWCARKGHRNARTEAVPDLWQAYLDQPSYEDQCRFAVEVLGGLRLSDIETIVDDALAAEEVAPRPEVCALAHALARHHRVWILTGSAEVLGKAMAARLGIRHAWGLAQGMVDGRLSPVTRPPVTAGVGKIAACWERLGRRPVFAIGDSPHDLPLLRFAVVGRTTGKNAGVELPAFP